MSHQSLVLTNFNQFEVRERTLAELAGDNAIVRILATAICGSDIHGSNGSTGRRFPDQVMGHETCGVVEKVSAQSSAELIGKRVVINPVISCQQCELCLAGKEYVCRSRKVLGVTKGVDGAFAQYVIVPVRNLALISEDNLVIITLDDEGKIIGYKPFASTIPTYWNSKTIKRFLIKNNLFSLSYKKDKFVNFKLSSF